MNTKPRTTRRRNLSITDADYARLQSLGAGNASMGIREALRESRRLSMEEFNERYGIANAKEQ